ncbi:MAG: isocitrate/isopropylmalate dehydrogenase family protein [Thermoleophilia bacterium]|nr:isocitrate/isopropylmalate dehydrogenase family protein [Thermoleophilia bacterium]
MSLGSGLLSAASDQSASERPYQVVCIPGDGIGPEIMAVAKTVVAATGVPIEWVDVEAGAAVLEKQGTPLPDEVVDLIRKTKVALKGPVTTPVGSGFRSINVALRVALDLFANVRPAMSFPGVSARFQDVDLVVVRENTEDLYAGIERMVDADRAESVKVITRRASERIARFAFAYARREARSRVTIVHKANIMKLSDGLFLETARKVAADFPDVLCDDRIVDNICAQLVQCPERYDILLCPNLYGDIISDLCAGLVGGLGLAPGANIGEECAVFEAVHGSAPDIAGQDKANPTALVLSAALMLKHLGEASAGTAVVEGVRRVLAAGRWVTPDLGGSCGTKAMGAAIAEEVARLA